MIAEVEKNVGAISFQFNNAGIGGAHKAIIDLSLAELDEIMNVSFRAVFIGMKYALPANETRRRRRCSELRILCSPSRGPCAAATMPWQSTPSWR